MIALDTSVVVPALCGWHEAHPAARVAAAGASIPAHALLESYSVLTRLPAPHRLRAEVAESLLSAWFPPARVLVPPAALQRTLLSRLVRAGIDGGAAYDAIVGLTAAGHGASLLTRDRRALLTYEGLDVTATLLEP